MVGIEGQKDVSFVKIVLRIRSNLETILSSIHSKIHYKDPEGELHAAMVGR